MKKKSIIALVVLGLIVLIVFRLASNKNTIDKRNSPIATNPTAIPVTVATVVQETLQSALLKTGELAPYKQATALATASGNVLKLNFELGTQVQQGQLLGRIDTRLLQLDLQKSQSSAAKLKRDLQTYSELLEGNAATREKVEEIRQNYTEAINRSSQLQRQISDATIKAPISGTISARPVEEGVFVTSGTQVATIVNLSRIKVTVSLSESEVYQIKEGQTATLQTEVYPDKQWLGKVSYINPQADAAHSYAVEITAENNKEAPLRSGTFVKINFSNNKPQTALLIPREALLESTSDASVYIIEQGRAILRPIKVGAQYNSRIAVLEGLSPGQKVVTSGQINLQNRTPVILSNN
ncbi:RND family efflux transporter, MFP subunit [Flavobacterium sp. CF108]|uniref:efflux RND transporter periplasmic adaptor subunit n=1 Tax=Flavobacterium sp. CF108 TaxID=1882758 RepID=UPI00091D79D3|nr:efflux RND transporter periplasmic adaptor subunit [Flavobacterium sp. CF108]SHH92093.1 RND family efflux transporter, MFP subunit [Flavobacterium sp. CF108]